MVNKKTLEEKLTHLNGYFKKKRIPLPRQDYIEEIEFRILPKSNNQHIRISFVRRDQDNMIKMEDTFFSTRYFISKFFYKIVTIYYGISDVEYINYKDKVTGFKWVANDKSVSIGS